MHDNLQRFSALMNSGHDPIAGLLSCGVESEDPPVLIYTFSSADDARRFKALREVQGTGFLYSIYPTRPTVVFEDRAPDPVDAEWQRLLEEHTIARDAYNAAFAAVNRRFVATAAQSSRENPTIAQVDASQDAWDRWQDVQRRMQSFVRKHTAK